MSRTTALVFDIGNVLSHFSFDHMVAADLQFTKLPAKEVLEILIKWSHPFCTGELDESAFAGHCMDELKFTGSVEDLKRIYNLGFQPNKLMAPVVERYADQYSLSYLSDTNPWHIEFLLARDPLLPHFQSGTTSFEAKVLKPDRTIYEFAARKHDFLPKEAIFIDDRAANVAGAEAVGYVGLHYKPDQHKIFEDELSATLEK